jgi:hypothetical protein
VALGIRQDVGQIDVDGVRGAQQGIGGVHAHGPQHGRAEARQREAFLASRQIALAQRQTDVDVASVCFDDLSSLGRARPQDEHFHRAVVSKLRFFFDVGRIRSSAQGGGGTNIGR